MMLRARRSCALLALSSCTVLFSVPASGQGAAAQALFDDARALMDAGKFAEACPKLAESQRLDPGGGTLLHLALCYEKAGMTASSWATFNEALSAALRDKRDDRRKVAEEHLAAITPKLTKLRLIVPPAMAGVEGLTVRRNGVETSRAEWGTAVPVDPGEVKLEISAPGKRTATRSVAAGAPGTTLDFTLPLLEDAPEGAAPAAEARSAAPAPLAPATAAPARDSGSGSGQRTLAYVAGGVGVLGIGAGTYFGLRSLSKKSEADKVCDGANCVDDRGVSLREDARSAGNLSTIFFIAGGAALATGVVLYLTAPDPDRPQAAVHPVTGPGLAGLGVSGHF